MNHDTIIPGERLSPLASIRRYLRPRPEREYCSLCDAILADEHQHLFDSSSRRPVCVCDSCAILFGQQCGARYRRVPRDSWFLPDFRLTELTWDSLGIPINLAFFVVDSEFNRVVAMYPSPGGATRALVPNEAWNALATDNTIIRTLAPDVEALLVNRFGSSEACYRVGVDLCYRLVGVVRLHWRGFSGGNAVHQEIDRYFATLKERSRHD
jgi:hypothetical protein